jgi:hypothetical protein
VAIALDTLAYARRLREAGFSDRQAEGQAEALAAAMTDTLATKQDLSGVEIRMQAGFAATKQDLSETETRLQAGIAAVKHEVRELETRMEARLADLEHRITLRMGTMMVAGFGVVSVLVKIL